LSDTVVFRSATTTEKDRDVAARLAPVAEVDAAAFGEELLRIKATSAEQKSAAAIVRDDYNEFDFGGGRRVGIAQVEVLRAGALVARKDEILREMGALREAGGLVQVVLMVTDVAEGASDLWFVGDRADLFERAFGPLVEGTVHVPGCMSRKKQVVPPLEQAFETSS
jgi:manganese-dependent inorganic pyrophosphatase